MPQCGIHTFSPICHSHPLGEYGVPGDWAFWRDYDLKFLAMCDEVWVLMLDEWKTSTGVCRCDLSLFCVRNGVNIEIAASSASDTWSL
jgi:hypothetical protein